MLLALAIGVLGGCDSNESPLPLSGTLERDRIELTAYSSETILSIPVREGDFVEAGTLIAQLDTSLAATRLRQAAAARDQAGRRLDELVRGPRKEDITEARASLEGARSEVVTRQREFERANDLVERGLAPDSDVDLERAARDRAIATRDEAAARLERLLAGTTIEELDQAGHAVEEAEARVSQYRTELERLTLTAPADARVDALPFEVGERPAKDRTVAVLLRAGAPYARVFLPIALKAQVDEDTEVTVQVDGRDETYAARARFVSSEAAFTPYFALNERDRGRLVYLAEFDLTSPAATSLPSGLPLSVDFPSLREKRD